MKLGIIGSSVGNGHPYSWSAIFNGYRSEFIGLCEFPGIPKYLAKQDWPDAKIQNAEVTHIWTQSALISENISKFANIPNIVSDYREMLSYVDAIIVARDDCENHFEFANFFSANNIPVMLDKPVAKDMSGLNNLEILKTKGAKIFSSSSTMYSRELIQQKESLLRLREAGLIKKIVCEAPGKWDTYAIHIIEPIASIFDLQITDLSSFVLRKDATGTKLKLIVQTVPIEFRTTGSFSGDILFKFHTPDDIVVIKIEDHFYSFKQLLQDFVFYVKNNRRRCRTNWDTIVKILSEGH